MKHLFTTIAIIAILFTTIAFTHSDEKKEGAIGDVKYSVLPPDKFREENGSGWVLMDDKVPLTGSALNTKHGVAAVPDARGLFIRCLNLNRADDNADPYLKENNRQRVLGDVQADNLKSHEHTLSNITEAGYSNIGNGQSVRFVADDGPSYNNTVWPIKATATGGNETRPKNIALFAYIKIND